MCTTHLPGWTLPSCNHFMWVSANPSSWTSLILLNYFNTGWAQEERMAPYPHGFIAQMDGERWGFHSHTQANAWKNTKNTWERMKCCPCSIKTWITLHKVELLCSTLACIHKRHCDGSSSKADYSLYPGRERCRAKHPLERLGSAWLSPGITRLLRREICSSKKVSGS